MTDPVKRSSTDTDELGDARSRGHVRRSVGPMSPARCGVNERPESPEPPTQDEWIEAILCTVEDL